MKKLLIATSAVACLLAAPLAAQAATASQPSTAPHVQKHATVRHHTSKHTSKAEANRREAAMKQHKANCPAGSQSAACQPNSTGSIKKVD